MTRRRRTAIHGAPLTLEEDTGMTKPQKPIKFITCTVCGKSGGTLIRVEQGVYKHKECGK